eukprot:TRINITY_DN23246_c0_g1_i8.p1 TRINITY_DN23246_c0_g1~~TRINITY_DN23246_c0_g1_i8.p1  ORF type:complete len:133 (+),score=12.77 TRINITY_DN23246_c0_g1_i8:656-1054(+)
MTGIQVVCEFLNFSRKFYIHSLAFPAFEASSILKFQKKWNSQMLALSPAFTNPSIPRGLLELRLSPNDRFSSSPLFHCNKIKSGHFLPPPSFHMFAYFSFYSATCIFFLEGFDGIGRRKVLGVLMEWNQLVL